MDGFNNMGEDNGIKADINVVDAPTAQNVVVEAPSQAEAAAESVAEPGGLKVQSQEDYFASAFSYGGGQQQDAGSADAFGTAGSYAGSEAYGSSQGTGNYNAGGNYGGNADPYGAGGNTYGSQNGYAGATGYASANTYGGSNAYGGATGGNYGYAQGYGNNNAQYGTPGFAQNVYPSNQEFSTPDYYGNNVYANDPFASYYEDDFTERKSNGKAIAALVLGISSLALTCSGIGIIPSIIAIILGAQGSKECEKARMASIGAILGIVGCISNLIRLGALILQITTSIMDYL